MPISNTKRLTQDDVDAMNQGFLRIGYAGNSPSGLITDAEIMGEPKPTSGPDRQGRRVGLAEYFGGLKPVSVVAWLTPPGQYPAYKPIVVARDGRIGNNAPYVGAIGRRLICLKPGELEGRSDPLNGLRDRMILAALLGVQGGIYREPILHGLSSIRSWTVPMLTACIRIFKTIWNGDEQEFFQQAWTSFTVQGRPGSWVLTMIYNQKANDQEFYNEEEFDPTDDYPGDSGECP